MTDCACPKHPFGCYGHPHTCGCIDNVTIPRSQYDALVAAARLNDRALTLLNIAFGEFACTAKYLPADEREHFEKNFAVAARALIDAIHESDAGLRAAGVEMGEAT